MTGPFVSKGTKLSVSNFQLKALPDGSITAELSLKLGHDFCPTWTNIAVDHLISAWRCRDRRKDAWRGANPELKAQTLEAEFEASMQAINAAAFSMDALFGCVDPHVTLDKNTTDKWRRTPPPRYARMSEILRRAFRLNNQDTVGLRKFLAGLYKLRDLAVHPSSQPRLPVKHEELGVLVEWRFDAFRAINAEKLVRSIIDLLVVISENDLSRISAINKYTQGLKAKIDPIALRLEQNLQ